MRLGKDAVRRQEDMGYDDALDYLLSQLTLVLATHDAKEGVQAFLEKRTPVWAGR
jgi:enoyl-CoA hydratase